jgi:acyl-CoA thioesterase-2
VQDMLSIVDSGLRTVHDLYTGPALPTPNGRSFGGQVMGQAIVAAGQTTPEGRQIHSMHGYFLRPGNSNEKLTFEVARLFDGGSFSTRRVQAYQDGSPIMSMIASFQTADHGAEHQAQIDMS